MKLAITILCSILSCIAFAQEISTKTIINNCIKFHDPEGHFTNGDYTLSFEESRPNGIVRKTNVRLAPTKEVFEIESFRENHLIQQKITALDTLILLDKKKVTNADTIKKYRLYKDRAVSMKNYYLYLWHLPMKLKDPGTIVHEQVKETKFNDHSCYEIKVTYDETVGHDIWYFYFDISTFQMVGYRFYHDESKNDGEYIYLDKLTTYKNIKVPANRKWYTHKEDKFLGSDYLVKIELNE